MRMLFLLLLPLSLFAQPKRGTAIRVQYAVPKPDRSAYTLMPEDSANIPIVLTEGCVTVGKTAYDVDSVTYIYSLPFRQVKYYLNCWRGHKAMARIFSQSFDGMWSMWFLYTTSPETNATLYRVREDGRSR